MKTLALTLALVSTSVLASPPCDESKGYYEVFGYCRAINIWDFTLTSTVGQDFTVFGGSGSGGSAGGASGAGAGSGGSGAGAGPGAAGGDSGGGDSGGDSGDSGGDSGDGGAGAGCAI